MSTIELYSKLDLLPENLKTEVSDFIDFLISKTQLPQNKPKAKFGSAKGFYEMKDDFDEPLDDFKEYME